MSVSLWSSHIPYHLEAVSLIKEWMACEGSAKALDTALQDMASVFRSVLCFLIN